LAVPTSREGREYEVQHGERTRAALLVVALMLGVAACGSSGGSGTSSGAGASTSAATNGASAKVAPKGSAENPFGATLPNGKYGENYNPAKADVDKALYGPAALPTDPMQRNTASAATWPARSSRWSSSSRR
jgi:F0F1-type ATP synthase membrane subunit c/vacuolar-type H+-ATPase subunit K